MVNTGLLDHAAMWVLFAVPEGLMMVVAGMGFLGIKRPCLRVTLIGIVVGTMTVLSRSFLPNGYHIPVILLSYCVLMVFVARVSLKSAAIAFFISSFLVNLGQVLVAFPVLRAMHLSVQDTLTNVWLHILFGWVGDTILLAGTVIVWIRNAPLIQVPESTKQSMKPGSACRDGQPSS